MRCHVSGDRDHPDRSGGVATGGRAADVGHLADLAGRQGRMSPALLRWETRSDERRFEPRGLIGSKEDARSLARGRSVGPRSLPPAAGVSTP
jgi:hypothetical protein